MHLAARQSRDERAVDAASFRFAMRQLVGGVSVIAAGDGEERSGMTATSVASISAEPPTLLVCINRSSSFHAILRRSRAFSVNLLAADQQHIAERFTGWGGEKGSDRYSEADWQNFDSGIPVLRDPLAAFVCDSERLIEHYTHVIVIGAVRQVRLGERRDALAYWQGAYARLGEGER